jgi:hypothetical protein
VQRTALAQIGRLLASIPSTSVAFLARARKRWTWRRARRFVGRSWIRPHLGLCRWHLLERERHLDRRMTRVAHVAGFVHGRVVKNKQGITRVLHEGREAAPRRAAPGLA